MKYNHYIFIVTYLIAVASCNAMKRESLSELCHAAADNKILNVESKLDIIGEITAVEKPYKVRSFGKDRAIILGKDRCSVVDLAENKEVQKVCSISHGFHRMLQFSFHTQGIILSSGDVARLYPINIKNNMEKWDTVEQDSIRSATFSLHEEALYFCYKNQTQSITKYNYATRKRENIVCNKGCCAMGMHPKEKIMCVVGNIGNIYFHDIDSMALKKSIMLPIPSCFFCEYSPDGSCIAVSGGNGILIVDPSKDEEEDDCWHYLEHDKYETLKKIVFHPEVAVVAGLFDAITNVGVKRILHCWDIKTQQIVYTSQLNSPFELNSGDAYDFDFSCDGSEFIIVAKDKCIRAKVPFGVIYQSTEKELLYHLFLLQQLWDRELHKPKEIEQYCAKLLLQAFKR